jgi:small subunit ribosomal protein S2
MNENKLVEEKPEDAAEKEVSDPAGEEQKTEEPVKSEEPKAAAEDGPTYAPEDPDEDYVPVPVTLKTLLEAGAHYGHKVEKWNPKMLPYIFAERSKIHIINLDLTLKFWERARKFIVDIASRGGTVLFVGTKDQAREVIKDAAKRCSAYYVNHRWLGGTLSNFQTIKNSISRMRKLEELLQQADDKDSEIHLGKKEKLGITRQLAKLETNLGGIREMKKIPDLIFVIDINKEAIAVSEGIKLHVPIVGLVDTNTDPARVSFPIPSNDDATRTIVLFVNAVADAVKEGREAYNLRMLETEKVEREKAAKPRSSGDEADTKNGTGKGKTRRGKKEVKIAVVGESGGATAGS